MPRTKVARPTEVVEDSTALVGAAVEIPASQRQTVRTKRHEITKDWQRQAWEFYDSVGELRFGANWVGNALSRVTLFATTDTSQGAKDLTSGPAYEAVEALFGNATGRSQMLNTYGIHLSVPGETYLVAEPQSGGEPDEWMTVSTDEIKRVGGTQWVLDRGDGDKHPISNDALVLRVWRPHPRSFYEADSPCRAVLPILREIVQLTKHVAASIDSRLGGAGLLLVPSEMTFATPANGVDPADPATDPFMVALTEAMLTPIEDRGSAAAIVPIVVKAPAATISAAQHMTFSTPLDVAAQSLRDEAIRRLALGMDLPPEVMLGQGDSNHWASWQVDESAIKVHIEPACNLLCDALTRFYLWPLLRKQNIKSWADFYVRADTSALRTRPNHSSEAIQLYDRLEISGEALRRETGFSEYDKPTDEDMRGAVLRKMAMGITNSDLTAGALRLLGIEVAPAYSTVADQSDPYVSEEEISTPEAQRPVPEIAPAEERRTLPQERENTRGLQRNPSQRREVENIGRPRNNGRTNPAPAASGEHVNMVLAACEVLAMRALERARNRIDRRGRQMRVCSAPEADEALKDAWVAVPRVASLCDLDPTALRTRLDAYTRAVLYSGVDHDPELLHRVLFVLDADEVNHAFQAAS